jgi:hypothetical protein
MSVEEEKPAASFIAPAYPHMGKLEKEIWDRFLMTTNLTFTKIEYDVRVGPGNPPAAPLPPDIAAMWDALTKLRIDAVGYRKTEIWIFEVKVRAGRSALGQVDSYLYWFRKERNPSLPTQAAIVCKYVDNNIVEVAMAKNIWIFQV